tara:strand:- start:1880 stop:2950 length:1071 start_codon:yes stop_codon:yes gene_type:complete
MKRITLLDLFSGIGGFHLGLEKAGFKVNSYFSEIDKHAISVYQNNFKKSKYVGSITDVRGTQLSRINAITFGNPCQDFSLAGKRQGMAGKRSSLILEAIRLIEECRPNFFIWENVKGTFSSNNREDFAAILQAFTNIGGYRLEWQLLNTKWFLPQNRERIYLVGYIGKRSGRQIFPIGQSNQRYDKQKESSATITSSYHKGVNFDNQLIVESNDTSCNQAIIGAMRGRNPDNPSDRTKGSPTEQRLEINQSGVSNTLTSVQKDNLVIVDFRYDEGFRWRKNKLSPTLTLNKPTFLKNKRIRRLTPIECERLQGFPDNWTQYGTEGLVSDAQRYKLCGNAVTVDVVQAVGKRIKNVL